MNQFDTIQSITLRLKELGDQLSSSKLSQEELAEFETLSRKLYEITVILNYKAKEEIYRNRSLKKNEPIKVEEEPIKKNVSSIAKEREEAETPPPGLIEFDFTGGNEPSKGSVSTESQTSKANDDLVTQKKIATEIEQNIGQEQNIPQDEITHFYEHFSTTYKAALKDKLSNAKIYSIKNAIGLNDKLQFIGELFDGNSDHFNQTIEVLDKLENNEVALKKLSEIAAQKKWDKEAEVVDRFVNIINRRYVD